MGRQILTVLLGVVLSYMFTAAEGYLLYRVYLSTDWSEPQLGALARYVGSPLIAIVVGGVVGALAKRRSEVLAALSLIPWTLVFLFSRRLDATHLLLLVLVSLIYILIGVVVARTVFRIRTRKEPSLRG